MGHTLQQDLPQSAGSPFSLGAKSGLLALAIVAFCERLFVMKLMYTLESIEMRVDDHKMCRDANDADCVRWQR